VACALLTTIAVASVIRLGDGGPDRPYFVGEGSQEQPSPDTSSPVGGQYATDPVALAGSVDQELMSKGASLPVDVVVAGELRTSTGGSISLAVIGAVAKAYRSARGWLVVGSRAGGASLWFVAEGGQPQPLLTGVDGLALAPDGLRVAWRAAAKLYLGTVTAGRVETIGEAASEADGVPVGFVGTGVLVASADDRYAVWWPHLNTYVPTWRHLPSGVYGALPDGRTLLAQTPGGSPAQPCLAKLDATAGLAVRAQTCDIPLNPGAVGWLSPDGKWLIAEGAVDAAVLVDLTDAFGDRRPALNAGPGPYGPAAWLDARTVVHAGPGHELVCLHLDRLAEGKRDALERIPVPGAVASEPVLVVPRLVG